MNRKLITVCACAALALMLLVGGFEIMSRAILSSRMDAVFTRRASAWDED